MTAKMLKDFNEFIELLEYIGFIFIDDEKAIFTGESDIPNSICIIHISRNTFGNIQYIPQFKMDKLDMNEYTADINEESIQLIKNRYKDIIRDKTISKLIEC